MSDEAIEQLLDRLDEVGGRAFETLVQQVYIEAATYAVWALVMFVLVFAGFRFLKRFGWFGGEQIFGVNGDSYERRETHNISMAIAAPIIVFVALVGFGNVVAAIRRLIHPEFWALNYLLERIP